MPEESVAAGLGRAGCQPLSVSGGHGRDVGAEKERWQDEVLGAREGPRGGGRKGERGRRERNHAKYAGGEGRKLGEWQRDRLQGGMLVGEGCSDGADLRSTSSFPCPTTLILAREDVAPVSAPVCKSVVGVCAWPVPRALGLCPSPSLNMGRKRVSLCLVRLRSAAALIWARS